MLLFDFTPSQLDLLAQLARNEAGKKLEIVFDDPANDQASMRRAIYLDGGIQMLQYLVDFDAKSKAEGEQKKRDLMDSDNTAAANTASSSQPSTDF